jgi:regulator of protease activity HflC (stomatin/prohibitin superfamily)
MTVTKLGIGLALIIMIMFYGVAGITDVQPGEVTIIIKELGFNADEKGMQEHTLGTGTHWMDPTIYDIDTYDYKFVQKESSMEASTKDGQPIQIDVSFEVGLIPSMVPQLHETVGHDYYEQIVNPKIRKAIRYATSTQLSDEIYQGKGRIAVQNALNDSLQEDLASRGILIEANVRDIQFMNDAYKQLLVTKAGAAQQVIIEERNAAAAVQKAIKVANTAEGEKQKRIKAAEAKREEQRLEGEGRRLQKEEDAKGILAIATAEAKGKRLLNDALKGPGGKLIRDIEVLGGLGKNTTVYGVPTGAPGTSAYIIDKALKGNVAIGD